MQTKTLNPLLSGLSRPLPRLNTVPCVLATVRNYVQRFQVACLASALPHFFLIVEMTSYHNSFKAFFSSGNRKVTRKLSLKFTPFVLRSYMWMYVYTYVFICVCVRRCVCVCACACVCVRMCVS